MANVAADDDVQRMIEKATSTYGRLDILCNNAGIMDAMTPAADVPLALWDRVLAINLTGPFLACRRAIPLMLQQGGGSIVNTASEAGLRGGAAGTPYTVSKLPVDLFCRGRSRITSSENPRVTTTANELYLLCKQLSDLLWRERHGVAELLETVNMVELNPFAIPLVTIICTQVRVGFLGSQEAYARRTTRKIPVMILHPLD